jgi:hypothetical protein
LRGCAAPDSSKSTRNRRRHPRLCDAVSGTAVTDWVDGKDKGNVETSAEEGKVEYRKTEE